MPELLPTDDLGESLRGAYPELDAVRAAAGDDPVYLVGGAVRDLLLGRGRADLDLVVVGDAANLAANLDADPVEHERFATAKALLDGHEVDIATARVETYPHPGALPEVEPAEDLDGDLRRRDFTINAMALPLQGDVELIDPWGGRADLEAGLLRALHERSFIDDPTRALRAARYAARFGFEPEPWTAELIRAVDPGTVSSDRRRAELTKLAAEPNAAAGFGLLGEWGFVRLRKGAVELTARVCELLSAPPWQGVVSREQAVLAAALGRPHSEQELADFNPGRPSAAVELANGADPVELILARALGGEWLDQYLEWRSIGLEIDGEDLIAAGVPQGPAVGLGLAAALRSKLDGEIAGREQELEVALAAAREGGG